MDKEIRSLLTAKQLIEILSELPEDTVIVVPSVEGNIYQADIVRKIHTAHAVEIKRDLAKEKAGLPQQPGADYTLHKTPRENSVRVVFIH